VSEESTEAATEPEEEAIEPAPRRDALSLALVAGLALLLLICVVLVFVANNHRPAGL
jgi:hypothetical protein